MTQPFWANLLHLSMNMWRETPGPQPNAYSRDLRCDPDTWNELTEEMVAAGCTMLVIDVGDGIAYDSHPEISVNGAWSAARLQEELARLREIGLEPIPKLNFSATHDAWLGVYGRMVATPVYYEVCTNLIREVVEKFDRPRFLHLGMDEEDAESQAGAQLAVTRQGDLWWHDLQLFADTAEAAGTRPWIWSDYAWQHPTEFYARMPQRILQSNWYYRNAFNGAGVASRPARLNRTEEYLTYLDLDDHGYDQVPTGSNWLYADNLSRTAAWARENLDDQRVLGFLQTPWKPTLPEFLPQHREAIADIARARELYGSAGTVAEHQGE